MSVIKISRRARPQAAESFADWLARMDTEVEAMTRKVCKRLPAERLLTGAQRRIVQMLAENLRSLPRLEPGEDAFQKREYGHINSILGDLFSQKYPEWKARANGRRHIDDLPNGEGKVFSTLLRNCAGPAPAERSSTEDDDE